MKRKSILGASILLVLLIGIGWYLFTLNYLQDSNPLAKTAVEQGDYATLAKVYLQNDVAIEERTWHGNAQAPVTIIAVIDFSNPISAQALTVLEAHTRERVEKGIIRIGLKYTITDGETTKAKDSFIYAVAARCLENNPSWMSDSIDLIEGRTSPEEIRERVGNEAFDLCAAAPALIEDRVHTQTQRIVAPSVLIGTTTRGMTELYGVPNENDLEQAIRSYEIRFGI